VDAVFAIAEETGVKPTQVALAWMATRGVIPILGARTAEQLAENLGATNVTLSPQQVARLDAASAIPLGFPHDMLAAEAQRNRLAGGIPDRVEVSPTPVA
jgi:diketogulonate reductase-like aldo/keto reductase